MFFKKHLEVFLKTFRSLWKNIEMFFEYPVRIWVICWQDIKKMYCQLLKEDSTSLRK